MTEVIGVRFKSVGKVYYFAPNNIEFKTGGRVIVETARGVECGEVVMPNRQVEDESIVQPLKTVIRAATRQDLDRIAENARKEKEAFRICLKKIADHKLDMKLIDVEYTFDNNKILFYFTADGRVDFRELVKDLASVFRTRIELRQIGVRDEAKMLGGYGICGRPFCCSSFLGDFQPVSIKMAKEQGLSLNPTKISGTCGRLMCCLKYEQAAYEDLLRVTPRVGATVMTPDGRATVEDANLLTGALRVRMEQTPDAPLKAFKRDDVTVIRGEGRADRRPAPEQDKPAGGETPAREGAANPAGKSAGPEAQTQKAAEKPKPPERPRGNDRPRGMGRPRGREPFRAPKRPEGNGAPDKPAAGA